MKTTRDALIIHVFALLHAVTALGCRAAGLQDDILLTILTMSMTLFICVRGRMSSMFMAVAILLINLLGYGLGWLFAHLAGLVTSSPYIIYPFGTFATTEVIGFLILAASRFFTRRGISSKVDKGYLWLLLAFVIIIMVRVILLMPMSDPDARRESINVVLNYGFSCLALACVALYAISVARRADEQKQAADLAQYRYMKLKQQVNPHFLFNSLNILDCMIQEQSPEQASLYTHKLADIYRYMIRNEEQKVVPLREEMDFVDKYLSLLKVRFTEGLEVSVDIPEEAMSRSVVPCCIQLLIENATKHNAVRESNPLHISISVEGDTIKVVNNLCPKVGRPSSAGLGLSYIRQQYMDLSGKGVEVLKTDTEFIARLPLL